MARRDTWKVLRYFKPDGTDNFGDPDAIDDTVLFRLDDFRHYLNCPFYVTSGVRPETDGKTSYHTRGKGACAVDVVMPEYKGNSIDLIFAAMRFGFSGIGYYPDWHWNGIKCGGLHLDTRPLGFDSDGTLNYGNSMWMGVLSEGKQIYIPLTFANLNKHIQGG